MKKITLALISVACSISASMSQSTDLSAIKLFIDKDVIAQENKSLTPASRERLFRKTTQLVNQTGIAEVGYSTFLVLPRLDVVSNESTSAGLEKIYLAVCELGMSIMRISEFDSKGEATFNSFSKRITGSGSTQDAAIANAVNNISSSDKEVIAFLNESKAKINDYFQTNCNQVLKQASQALTLKRYAQSIALYFSVPSNAPCYSKALEASEKVYMTYVEDDCNKSLVKMKMYIALAQTENSAQKQYYDSAFTILKTLNPASDMCFAEAKKQIEKVEKRLNDQQKQEWEITKKIIPGVMEGKKEMYKAMGRISTSYVPTTKIVVNR